MEKVVFECYNDVETAYPKDPNGCKKRFIGLILFKVTVEEIQKVLDE